MLGALAGLILAFAALLIGLPLIERGRGSSPRRPARDREDAPTVLPHLVGPAFEPLELAASGMAWPSEVQRPITAPALLKWPSETWTDSPFRGGMVVEAGEADEAVAVARPQSVERGAPARAPAPSATKARAEAKAPTKAQPPRKGRGADLPSTRPAAAQPPARASSTADAAPSSAEVLRVAEERGLAAAVDMVRDRTGWPFQRAAQHVAMILRGHE
jgi:hypothetical protein